MPSKTVDRSGRSDASVCNFVVIHRVLFDHPLFRGRSDWAGAFIWMIAEAAWQPRSVRISGWTIKLRRGQLAHSIRYMAQAWGWSKSRVDRFLECLKNEAVIETQNGTGMNVITICNYSKYQDKKASTGTRGGTQSGTRPGHERDKANKETKKQEDKKEESKKERPAHISRGTPLPDDWQPSADDLAYAGRLGITEQQTLSAAEDMRLWAHANRNRAVARKADWSATLRGWIRRNLNNRHHNGGSRYGQAAPNSREAKRDEFREAADKLRSFNRRQDGGEVVSLLPPARGR
jgi:DNA-binding transcriptional regulator YhcF (GntR family)